MPAGEDDVDAWDPDGAWAVADLLGLLVDRNPMVRPDAPVYLPAQHMIAIAPGLPPDEEDRQIMWVIQRDHLQQRN